jgi:hypothetical protein
MRTTTEMTAFTYKGYGRIYTNPENIKEVEAIIKELDEFEWSYYPEKLVTSWDEYPSVEYIGKFELTETIKFKEICKERNIPVFIFDAFMNSYTRGYCKTLNKEEIKTLSYGELK